MASISNLPEGRRAIQFKGADGRRHSVRLGKVQRRVAEAIKLRVEELVNARVAGQALTSDTALWVQSLDRVLTTKLARAGLIPKRETVTLASFLDAYIEGRTDIGSRTRNNLRQARGYLVRFFGANKLLSEITPGDADDFRRQLLTTLGLNTVRRYCGLAKQFFRAALRKRLIPFNPFADMRDTTVRANPARERFVSVANIHKVLEACPDVQWRLIFALARFGGLRTPSETLQLRWSDVDWERGRFRVRSPKTAHHEGQDSRVVPIFPELLPFLREGFEAAEPGVDYVITRYRDNNANLRTQALKIVERAGLEPWPKLFQNLRASRATELAAEYPGHVAAEWAGHSTLVAQKHYWRTTEADFEKAAGRSNGIEQEKSGAKSGAREVKKVVQIAVQQPAPPSCTE